MERKLHLFPQDTDVVLYETGFEVDILERGHISKQLSDLVERIESPIVIALDDKWGSGKSYFLKRWAGAHQKENNGSAITVYFDAFESDYMSEPLISIISAVSERIPKESEETLQKWKSVATKLVKPAFGIALSLATFGAKQHLDEIGDVIVDAVSSEAKDAAQSLWAAEIERKDAIRAFKDLLTELTIQEAKPIVIIVDELDRCRPDYALSVLEIIKHFFAVPNVHFVLGINGSALEDSVRARYGADIDAESYLRKFINVSFSLPRFVGKQDGLDVVKSYASQMSSEMELPKKVSERCIQLLGHVAKCGDVSLRDVGKILSKIALLPSELSEKDYLSGWINTLCVLLVSSVVRPTFHKSFISGTATTEQIMNFVGASKTIVTEKIDGNYNPEFDHEITFWVVTMMFCCTPEELEDADYLPSWRTDMGSEFNHFGGAKEAKNVPSIIQNRWVEIFRL